MVRVAGAAAAAGAALMGASSLQAFLAEDTRKSFFKVAEAYPAVPLGGVAAAPPEDAAEAAEGDDEEEDEGAE